MEKLLNKTHGVTYLPFHLPADELIYSVGKTYTLARPLFAAALAFDSSIQWMPTDTTDTPTDEFVHNFYTVRPARPRRPPPRRPPRQQAVRARAWACDAQDSPSNPATRLR